jgi:hypothetical protein
MGFYLCKIDLLINNNVLQHATPQLSRGGGAEGPGALHLHQIIRGAKSHEVSHLIEILNLVLSIKKYLLDCSCEKNIYEISITPRAVPKAQQGIALSIMKGTWHVRVLAADKL